MRKVVGAKKTNCGGFKVLKMCVIVGVGIWLVHHVKRSQEKTRPELETDAGVVLKLGRRDLPNYVQQAGSNITEVVEEPKGHHQLDESHVPIHKGGDDEYGERAAEQVDHSYLQFLQKESETKLNMQQQQQQQQQQHFSAFIASSSSSKSSNDTTVVAQEIQVKEEGEDLSNGVHEPMLEEDEHFGPDLHITTSNQTNNETASSSISAERSVPNVEQYSLNTYDESSNRSVAESGTEANNNIQMVEARGGDNLQGPGVRQVSNSDDALSSSFGGDGSSNNNDRPAVTERTEMSSDQRWSTIFRGDGSFNSNDQSSERVKTEMSSEERLSSSFGGDGSSSNNDRSAVTERTDMSSDQRWSSTFGGDGSFNNDDQSSVREKTGMSTDERLSSSFGEDGRFNNNDQSAVTERTNMSTENLNSTLAELRPEEDGNIDDTASRTFPYITRMQ